MKVVGCQEDYLKQFIGFVGIAYGGRDLYHVESIDTDDSIIIREEYLEVVTNGH